MQTVLTIAGFDPSSGAGITADLMVFAAHSLFGTSAITALTVQSTIGVRSTHPVPAEVLRETLQCLDSDLPPAGIKIGMLATAANVETVCLYIEDLRQRTAGPAIPIVLDPVLRSTSGRELLDTEGVSLLRTRLLPLVDWATPNLDELAILTGIPVATRSDLPQAVRTLLAQTTEIKEGTSLGIFATGGDLNPPDDYLLPPNSQETWISGARVETRATHGTGCGLSSAFLSRLVHGDQPVEAARAAKQYITTALQTATPRGRGSSSMNHLWKIANP
jgi:hydroxymethylpyrimidine/phosphomethylpyrimidine kinase